MSHRTPSIWARNVFAGAVATTTVAAFDAWLASRIVGMERLQPDERAAAVHIAFALGFVAGVGLGLAAAASSSAWSALPLRLRAPIERRAAEPLVWIASLALGCAAIALVGTVREWRWAALPWRLVALGAVTLLLHVGWARLLAPFRSPAPALGLSLVSVLAVGHVAVWSTLGDARDEAIVRLATESRVAAVLVRAGRALGDGDGDAAPRWLCGEDCDCDDRAPEVHPRAIDHADNGIDEDCDGVDLTRAHLAALVAEIDGGEGARRVAQHRPPPSPGVISSSEPPKPPNILLIQVDTLRADHLGTYGYGWPTSPTIDALASRGTVFDQARATGPMTRFSVGPMMAGRWFSELRRSGERWPRIHRRETMLAEVFASAGYRTAAFHTVLHFARKRGFEQGFEHYDDSAIEAFDSFKTSATGAYLVDRVLAFAETPAASSEPWFYWVYFSDPHATYLAHEAYRDEVPSLDEKVGRYDSEIRYTDAQIARLLEGLGARGQLDESTVVVVLSDHGEALDVHEDHGQLFHGETLHDEVIRVPWVLVGPGVARQRVDTSVSLLDVGPTLLGLAGIEAPEHHRGFDLGPLLRGQSMARPPVFFEKLKASDELRYPPGPALSGMVDWPWKVVWMEEFNRFRIYNLADDPGEDRNLHRELDARTRNRLRELVRTWRAHVVETYEPRR